jgi:flagellar basal-body rod protein FlgG
MIRAFNTCATGMAAQQTVLDNTANNLANLNTTGFKSSSVEFQDLLYETIRQPGATSTQGLQLPTGLQLGTGVKVAGTSRLFTQGSVQTTGNSLNMAINGNGFFQITNPAGGFYYTRDGTFQLNATNQLVTADGYLVYPAMTFPTGTQSITVGSDGTVSVTTATSPGQSTQIGQLTITNFPNPAGLSAFGNNLFIQSPASGQPITTTPGLNGTGLIQGGALEQSNVNVVQEMVNLIQAQRAYEFNTKAIQAADQMLASSTSIIR